MLGMLMYMMMLVHILVYEGMWTYISIINVRVSACAYACARVRVCMQRACVSVCCESGTEKERMLQK